MSEEQAVETVTEDTSTPTPPDPIMDVDSARASVDRAFEAMESGETSEPSQEDVSDEMPAGKNAKIQVDDDLLVVTKDGVVPETKIDAKGREHNPDGTFKAKEDNDVQKVEKPPEPEKPATNFTEPPNRFSADAKSAWKDAPEPVRAEIHRAVKELESGIEKYREDNAAFEPIREYDKLAKEHGTTVVEALDRYTNLERMLNGEGKLTAIQDIMSYAGVSPQDFALQILQQSGAAGDLTPEQMEQVRVSGQQDDIIRGLRNELAALKQEITGVSTTVQQQKDAEIERQVIEFAADKPRFDELSEDIKFFIESGRTQDLAEAYDLAERLNPAPAAPAPATAEVEAEEPEAEAQTKASLSVTGAPSSGSNPVNRKPPSSAGESVSRAFATLGIR